MVNYSCLNATTKASIHKREQLAVCPCPRFLTQPSRQASAGVDSQESTCRTTMESKAEAGFICVATRQEKLFTDDKPLVTLINSKELDAALTR